jgi:dolichol-phosphate mannosyltransferase
MIGSSEGYQDDKTAEGYVSSPHIGTPTISWTGARDRYSPEQRRGLELEFDEADGAAARSPERAGPKLSVIVPTFNERENVAELVERLKQCLADRSWDVIFVDDDSPDGTAERVRELAEKDGRIRCIRRIGRRGLSSACVEGMLASSAPYLAVIDADLQHDERLLPQMLATLEQGDTDIVVGSRYAPGGDIEGWNAGRARMSRLAVRLSRVLVPAELTDPMSGFFMMRRAVFDASVRRLSAIGFKILTDLFSSSPQPLRFKEVPYRFRPRHAGQSKLDSVTAWDYAMLLLDKLVGHVVPVRFLAFSIVGALGVAVHFAVLALLLQLLQRSFIEAQAAATLCAMTCNFAVNNVLTYRDRRLRGSRWLRGWMSFILACSIGGFMNLGAASFVYGLDRGWFLAAITGILIGSVWNYAVTKIFTWGRSGI